MSSVRHKVFISYHHDDQDEVDDFVNTFDEERDVFIARGLGIEMADDIIDSDDAEYVMRRIRELYLRDSTVTAVLIGKCTWARRFVDWEIQASLRHGESVTPNGLIGILLPSRGTKAGPPDRLKKISWEIATTRATPVGMHIQSEKISWPDGSKMLFRLEHQEPIL